MLNRFILGGLMLALYPCASSYAKGMPSGLAGWYNGDWQTGIPGASNYYVSPQQFGRTYDDFVVPDGGWTVVGVFAHNSLTSAGITQASWEIRSRVSAGNPGTLVASGLSPATQTLGPAVGGGAYVYLIEVDGLWVQLAPDRYWLSVTPVVSATPIFAPRWRPMRSAIRPETMAMHSIIRLQVPYSYPCRRPDKAERAETFRSG